MRGHQRQTRRRRRSQLRSTVIAGTLFVLVTGVPAHAQTATNEFLDRLGELSGRAGNLLARAETINANWEGREIGFSETAGQLQELETDAALLFAAVQDIAPPDEFSTAMDQLAATASDISAAASAMVAGLRVDDSGQARQAAADQFRDSVATFQNLVAGMVATAATTTTTITTTTTSTTIAAATTTAATAPTTTIAIELGAPPGSSADDGGAPWALVPIALMAGLAAGLLGGMILGAKTRRGLIDQLKAARGNANGPG